MKTSTRLLLTLNKGGGYRTVEVPATVIATGEDGIAVAGGWGGVSGGTLSVESTNVRRVGHNVLKALASAGASTQFLSFNRKISPVALTGNIEFWIYLPPKTAGVRSLILTYSSDTPAADPPTSNATNRRAITINPDVIPSSGWFCLQIHRDGKLYSEGTPTGTAWAVTGSPDINEIEHIRVFYTCDAATPDAERYILLDQVAINGRGRPCILLGFDSAAQNHVDVALPLFQARNIKGYNAVDGDQVAANIAKLSPLYDASWDVISQGIGHTNYASSPSGLAADIVTARAAFTSAGYLRAQDIFMYPQNSRIAANDTVAAANGIRMGVASPQQHMPASSLGKPNFVGQAGRMGAEGVGITFAGRWKAWVDEAVLSGKSLILYSHNLVTTASSGTETTTSEYTALLDYVAALRDAGTVDVLTPSQYLTRFD